MTVGMLWAKVSALTNEIGSLQEQLAAAESAAVTSRERQRDAVMNLLWAANSPLTTQPTVNVVIPTAFPERLGSLRAALDSVLAQSYGNWRAIVVDNGLVPSLDPLPRWWPDDERIHLVREPVAHAGRARNIGLAKGAELAGPDAAAGELVAYLDDDCRWFPWWLHAAVAAFERQPDVLFAYGVRMSGRPGSTPAIIQAEIITALRLHINNYVDTNALVHRASTGLQWDEQLTSCLDYDLLVRLQASVDTVADGTAGGIFVPVPAVAYGIGTAHQQWGPSNRSENNANLSEVRSRARQRRPLRVVAYNALYPLITETYIGDELAALQRAGVELVAARGRVGPSPTVSRVDGPLYESLAEAIEAHDPDLVLCHWAQVGIAARRVTTPLGIPHAIRLHSFCEPTPNTELYVDHCIGTWGPPHHDRGHPLAHTLPTLILEPGDPVEDDSEREAFVFSVSAGLPKKDWRTLAAAGAMLDGIGLQVVTGVTAGYEHLPHEVRGYFADAGLPDTISINMPYDDVQDHIRRASALVYSLGPGHPTGQPRSVLEAALAATPLALPDTRSLRLLVGDTAAYYTPGDTAGMAAAMRQAVTAPAPIGDRLALAERIRAEHSAPELATRWAREITAALVDWHDRRRSGRIENSRVWWHG